jgi:hypothetical protein
MGEPTTVPIQEIGFYVPCEGCAPRAGIGPCVTRVAPVMWLTCSVCGGSWARHVTLVLKTPAAAGEEGRHAR